MARVRGGRGGGEGEGDILVGSGDERVAGGLCDLCGHLFCETLLGVEPRAHRRAPLRQLIEARQR